MRKICCFCEKWESGGIESFLHNMLLRMELTDAEVDIVAACLEPSVFTAALEAKGVRFVQLSGSQRNLLRNYRMFRQLLRQRKYDVVHFNLFQGLSLYYVQIAKQEGVPVRIAHSHNTDLRKSLTRPLKLLLHRLGSRLFTGAATELWACSRLAAEFLFAPKVLKTRRYTFIPNGIETERFRFDPAVRRQVREKMALSDALVIGHVGRLCYQKNQRFLLDVLAELKKIRPDSRLLLVGDGEDRAMLEDAAQQLGLTDSVIFYGVTNEVEKLFCAMDVFVFPSRFEGLGIVAVEAQASGLPVLCSTQVPAEARLSDRAGMLSLEAGPHVWAQAIASAAAAEDRIAAADWVRAAGFEVCDGAKLLEKKFLEEPR